MQSAVRIGLHHSHPDAITDPHHRLHLGVASNPVTVSATIAFIQLVSFCIRNSAVIVDLAFTVAHTLPFLSSIRAHFQQCLTFDVCWCAFPPQPTASPDRRKKKQAEQLSTSQRISRLPCAAVHTPTVMLAELVNQLIGARKLRAVGPAPAMAGNARNFEPLFMSFTANITKHGAMFKCPAGVD